MKIERDIDKQCITFDYLTLTLVSLGIIHATTTLLPTLHTHCHFNPTQISVHKGNHHLKNLSGPAYNVSFPPNELQSGWMTGCRLGGWSGAASTECTELLLVCSKYLRHPAEPFLSSQPAPPAPARSEGGFGADCFARADAVAATASSRRLACSARILSASCRACRCRFSYCRRAAAAWASCRAVSPVLAAPSGRPQTLQRSSALLLT